MVKVMRVVKGQGHVWPSNFKVKILVKVKPIGHIWGLEFNRYLCFSFHGNRTTFGWDIGNSIIWPWKFKVKVMAKVKPDGHIWGLGVQSICLLFISRGNRTIFGWDIGNSTFDLENSRSRSRRKSTKFESGNLLVRANNHAKNERNPKSCSKVIAWTRSCGRRLRTNRYKNIKSPLVYRGDLITFNLLLVWNDKSKMLFPILHVPNSLCCDWVFSCYIKRLFICKTPCGDGNVVTCCYLIIRTRHIMKKGKTV